MTYVDATPFVKSNDLAAQVVSEIDAVKKPC